MALTALSDSALAARAAAGDSSAFAELVRRYRSMIYAACPWAPIGLTREDLRQEALLGLYEACRDYNPGRGAFDKCASSCVYLSVQRARRDATRLKHRVLSEALWSDDSDASEDWRPSEKHKPATAERVGAPAAADPARIVELREELRGLVDAGRWRSLRLRRDTSDVQIRHALELVAAGRTLRQAAAAVGVSHQTVMRWRRSAA